MESRTLSSAEDARDLLRVWREENVRRSDDVVDIWDTMLYDTDLGDEQWMVLEQVAVAALDVHRRDVVDDCVRRLSSKFDSESLRMRRLKAMRAEMHEDWETALLILDQILEDDDANSQARKRKIAILKAQCDNHRAIAELNKYLKEFMCDEEAWMELCELYILEQEYAKAAFCCEELILQHPHDHLYYQRYAEIRYTQGGFEHMEMAKTYYCHTVRLNPNNMRALYGLLLTCTQLASSPKCTAQKKREYVKTVMWAAKQIKMNYEKKLGPSSGSGSGELPVGMLEGLMGQLQIQAPVAT